MKAEEVIRKIDPETVIGLSRQGFRGGMYIGMALDAIKRTDLSEREVDEIALELIDSVRRICVYVK